MCVDKEVDNATRAHMLKTMYNIVEKKEVPSVWDRLSDRQVQAKFILAQIERPSQLETMNKVKKIKANKKKNK